MKAIWAMSVSLLPLFGADSSSTLFETQVRPVLASQCYGCHTHTKMGGLRLDSRDAVLKGGNSGPAIVPGDPDNSLLIQAVRRTHAKLKMPPTAKLGDREVQGLEAWVKEGAKWPETPTAAPQTAHTFWAFQPVSKPAAPNTSGTAIDRFVRAKLATQGLHQVKPADKRTLLRRVTFDLIGLPPTPAEVDAFVADHSPQAFAKVVDRLLASPHYGERWGRHWLDLARYSDGDLGASQDTPYPNAYRYRDWVIQAFNNDMPYDTFVKAQLAADLLPEKDREKLLPGLGFYALGPGDDDRVDVTGQVFLGLTVGCAKCHDHKYDPIPTRDFYSLFGVFQSSEKHEFPLAPQSVVDARKAHQDRIQKQKYAIEDFVNKHNTELSEILVHKTSRYMMAAWEHITAKADPVALAAHHKLDEVIIRRMAAYLQATGRDHKFLEPIDQALARKAPREEMQKAADNFQRFLEEIFATRHGMEDRNYVKLGGAAGVRDESTRQWTNLESLPIEKYYVWRDFASDPYKKDFFDFKGGVYFFGAKDKEIDRWLAPEWREHLDNLRAQLAQLEKDLPPPYPFLHTLKDRKKIEDAKIRIRGDAANLGEVAPRRFLQVLSKGEPAPFQHGSGRLELAERIASRDNPLFARVMVNRIWQHHFGQALVGTPSNFGQLGDKPTHPELLDYLAARFIENGWSTKSLHREILLSETYQLSSAIDEKANAVDPANKLLWRANLQKRLDAESLRDTLLMVAGKLDLTAGGPSVKPAADNYRRTVYTLVNRTKPDPELAMFDFPNPNSTAEQRMVTVGPMVRLYFMNSPFVAEQAQALSARLEKLSDDRTRIREAYRILFAREPGDPEVAIGMEYLTGKDRAWPQYVQMLLASAEFSSLN
ncbi:MAG: PSD1 domain-containing protein [Bryobacterales bacterium]|nr:PSD1 domain-containing protein [Bryobacterales bacterium]